MTLNIFNKDGEKVLAAPIKFENIVREQFYISKNLHTSFQEAGQISVPERKRLVQYLQKEAQELKEFNEKLKKQQGGKVNGNG